MKRRPMFLRDRDLEEKPSYKDGPLFGHGFVIPDRQKAAEAEERKVMYEVWIREPVITDAVNVGRFGIFSSLTLAIEKLNADGWRADGERSLRHAETDLVAEIHEINFDVPLVSFKNAGFDSES